MCTFSCTTNGIYNYKWNKLRKYANIIHKASG